MSSSSNSLNIFNKPVFENDIVREMYKTYAPHTKSFNSNDIIELSVNQLDACLAFHESLLCIDGNIKRLNAAGESVTIDNKITFVDNMGAFLFESLSYELNGFEVERCRDPGILSTIKILTTYTQAELLTLETAGWGLGAKEPNIFNTDRTKFHLRIPLKIFFNVFDDYKRILMGKHNFRLVRARSDVNCYKVPAEFTDVVQFEILNIELKVKHIIPNDTIKLQLLNGLNKNTPVLIPFRKWDLYEMPSLKSTTKEIWPVKTSSSLERPRYVLMVFQTDKKDKKDNNCTFFNHLSLMSLKVHLNSEVYPYEGLRMDFQNNDYIDPYNEFTNFQSFYRNLIMAQPSLSYNEFAKRTIYIVDCSKQNEAIQQTTVDLKIEFESQFNFAANTRAFCVIIHDALIQYEPLTGLVMSIV